MTNKKAWTIEEDDFIIKHPDMDAAEARAVDNCMSGIYNCDSCVNNGNCVDQGIDGRPRWEE